MNTTLNYTVTKSPKNNNIKVYYKVGNSVAGNITFNPWAGEVKITESNDYIDVYVLTRLDNTKLGLCHKDWLVPTSYQLEFEF